MITIAGTGVAGLATAFELAKQGCDVTIYEAGSGPGVAGCARYAGGMLAPWCEGETAEPEVVALGTQAADWWAQITPVTRRGTLVLATGRDKSELARFARRTTNHRAADPDDIARLEPALAGQFKRGLFFAEEAHLDPRTAILDLTDRVTKMGVTIHYNTPAPDQVDLTCTGMAAALPDLRPVRGEMAVLYGPDITIQRTIRLLHPRVPIYVVPRGKGTYMIGATMIESSATRPITVRSLSDLLGAAYTLHPGFAEASVVETGAGLRPAFPDNLPRIIQHNGQLHLNGFYRHGFLLAPAMAAKAAQHLLSEVRHENHRQRRTA